MNQNRLLFSHNYRINFKGNRLVIFFKDIILVISRTVYNAGFLFLCKNMSPMRSSIYFSFQLLSKKRCYPSQPFRFYANLCLQQCLSKVYIRLRAALDRCTFRPEKVTKMERISERSGGGEGYFVWYDRGRVLVAFYPPSGDMEIHRQDHSYFYFPAPGFARQPSGPFF